MGKHDSEADARILIDALLRQAGWDPADKSQVRTEVSVSGSAALRDAPDGVEVSKEEDSQFAIIPGSFDPALASSPNALDLGIGCLNDLCRGKGLFLDLRAGEWSAALENVNAKGKVFLKFARNRHRIVQAPPQLPTEPEDDESWMWEAQAYHQKSPCQAIIAPGQLAEQYSSDQVVAGLEKLNQTEWWAERSASLTIKRRTKDYRSALALVMRHAHLLMFIDACIDPCAPNYEEFPQLLLAAGSNENKPTIEIHRASWRKVGGKNKVQPLAAWIADFDGWSEKLARADMKADVFIWEDTHDRYLVSDIISISLPYGFDIGGDGEPPTTWSRIGTKEIERLQLEYEPSCKMHGLVGSFSLGKVTDN